MAWVRHGTLTGGVVEEVTLPNRSFSTVEVTNVDGEGEIYFLVQNANNDDDPELEGDDCEVLPSTINALQVNAPDPAPVTVKLISFGTPKYSVRAE